MNGRDKRTAIPDFQHRHFRYLAQIVREEKLGLAVGEVFASRLRATNPNFDTARFLDACIGEA